MRVQMMVYIFIINSTVLKSALYYVFAALLCLEYCLGNCSRLQLFVCYTDVSHHPAMSPHYNYTSRLLCFEQSRED